MVWILVLSLFVDSAALDRSYKFQMYNANWLPDVHWESGNNACKCLMIKIWPWQSSCHNYAQRCRDHQSHIHRTKGSNTGFRMMLLHLWVQSTSCLHILGNSSGMSAFPINTAMRSTCTSMYSSPDSLSAKMPMGNPNVMTGHTKPVAAAEDGWRIYKKALSFMAKKATVTEPMTHTSPKWLICMSNMLEIICWKT